ncbi:MAG: hypothetical protein IJX97_07215 [Clostridia bacterium]|nr:hypothetical protein [Clostridia bacterium]
MKKSIIKNVSALLTFVLFLSTFFGVSAQAISTLCVEDHFTNLVTTGSDSSEVIRTPPSEDSCPYTAMSMLLSFYDSYWRDDFIVSADGINETDWEQGVYDPTTDTLIETFSASKESKAWRDYIRSHGYNYSEFITNPDNDHYLESYLISLAKEINLCDEDDTVFGLKGYEIVDFLEYYLYDVRGFTEDQITVHMQRAVNLEGGDELLFEQMVNHINAGFPLIYGGSDLTIDFSQIEFFDQIASQTGGHAMIAYSFDGTSENPTDINLHTGWSGNEHIESVNGTEYNVWNLIIWLEIDEENLPHQCTDAYRNPTNTQSFCACQVYSSHPAHNNNHISVNGNNKFNDTHHYTNACHCDQAGPDSVLTPHDLSYVYISGSDIHHQECDECGYSDSIKHKYNRFVSISDTHHTRVCACGASSSAQLEHVSAKYVSSNTSVHGEYCDCGHLIRYAPHNMRTINVRYSGCIDCGYIRVNDEFVEIIKKVGDVVELCKE